MKVMKFGGGCLKNPDHLTRAVDILIKENRAVAVVSAVSGITDLLIEGIPRALESESSVTEVVSRIRERHAGLIEASIQKPIIRNRITEDIEIRLSRLERLLFGIAYTGEITNSTRAYILSFGERLSALTLTGALLERRKESISLEADHIGMITDDSFDSATAYLPETVKNLRKNILPAVEQGKIPVVTGYFGRTPHGKLTTFGRNGTDYSAAVIAHSIHADLLEIWKDVDGFMSADPRIVEGAHNIDTLSYYEAAELSYFGARILHPRTVEPLVGVRIPIIIKNLYAPENSGTQILPAGYEKEDVIKSVTFNKDISVMRIKGPGVGYKSGIIAKVGKILSDAEINIYSVITSQTRINLLVAKTDAQRSYESLKGIEGGVIESIEKVENIALVAVVGEGVLQKKGLAARVFSAVAAQNINVLMTSAGASEVAYYFIVEEKDLAKTILAVHNEFFPEV